MTDAQSLDALLRRWCRVNPARAPRGARLDRRGWDRLVRTARREGVAGLVHRAVGEDPLGRTAPRDARNALRMAAFAQAAASTREESVLAEVLDAMESGSVRPILLRGLALVEEIYRDGSLRPQVDHDLLVPCGSLAAARAAVCSIGFRPSPGGGGPYLRGPSVIDLHTDPYDRDRVPARARWIRADTEAFLERAVPARVAGRAVALPSRVDRVLHLCAHAVKHSFDRLIRLVDIAECWRARGFDHRLLVRRARNDRTADALFFALMAARARLGVEVPFEVLDTLNPGPLGTVDDAFLKVLAGRPAPFFSERLLLARLDGVREKAAALRQLLWPRELADRARETPMGTIVSPRLIRLAARAAFEVAGSVLPGRTR